MRRKFSPFRRKSQLNQKGFHPVAQKGDRLHRRDPSPQDARLLAGRETSKSNKTDDKGATPYAGKSFPDVLENAAIHLAYKTQSEMNLIIRHKARTRKSTAESRDLLSHCLRQIKGNKKPRHYCTSPIVSLISPAP